jgi:O-antigen ligase
MMPAQRPSGLRADILNMSVAIAAVLLAPVLGSVSSTIIFAIAILGGVAVLARRRLPDLPRPVKLSALAFASFFAAELLSGIVHWNGWVTLGEIGENIAFLGLIPCYMLIVTPRDRLLTGIVRAAPWCALGAFAIAAFQQFALDFRPQAGAGNAGVFAVTVAIVFSFTLANLFTERRPAWFAIALIGVLAAAATLILSGTRALWPCLVIFPLVLWFTAGWNGKVGTPWRTLALGFVAIAIAATALAGTLGDAYRGAASDIEAAHKGNYQTRLGKRFVIWQVGMEAVRERPILGHGLDAPRRIMEERTPAIAGKPIAFSHFHNVVLNEMIRAGVVGTAALAGMLIIPLFLTAGARKDRTAMLGFGLLICFQAAFLLSGMVNIMLDHDIMDSQFLANTVLCLYLVFGHGGGGETDNPVGN